MAAIAGFGGVLSIVMSICLPIWMSLHGHPYSPAFSLFTCWGIFALGGAYGCLHTYRLTDTPPRPHPPGGLPVTVLRTASADAAASHDASASTIGRAA
jgi:hypothetical protein